MWWKKKKSEFLVTSGILMNYKGNHSEVEIPDNVKYIGDWSLNRRTDLVSVKIPESVTVIGNSAFRGCMNLVSADIPDSVTELGESAFLGCENLTSIRISKRVQKINRAVFYKCKRLTFVTLPEHTELIGENAFYGCESLETVTVPDSVINIEDNAFAKCKRLKSIRLSENLIHIGNGAFSDCESLKCVEIPDKVMQNAYIDDFGQNIPFMMFGKKFLTSVPVSEMARMVQRLDFENDMPSDVKYSLITAFYRKTGNKIAGQYLTGNMPECIKGLTQSGDTDYIKEFAERGWITKDCIDECINYAIELKQQEIYILLLRYKTERFGFDNVKTKFDF